MAFSSTSTEVSPSTYAHGMSSKMTIGGVGLCITKFEFNVKYDKHDVTSTCNNGKRQYQYGLAGVDFTGEAHLDLAESPFVAITAGAIATVSFSVDGTVLSFYSTKCVINDIKITQVVNDVITWSFSGSGGPDYQVA